MEEQLAKALENPEAARGLFDALPPEMRNAAASELKKKAMGEITPGIGSDFGGGGGDSSGGGGSSSSSSSDASSRMMTGDAGGFSSSILGKVGELSPEAAGMMQDGSISTESAMSFASSKARSVGLGSVMEGANSFKGLDGKIDKDKLKEQAMAKMNSLKGGFGQLGGMMNLGDGSKSGYSILGSEMISDAEMGDSAVEPDVPDPSADPWLAMDAEADLMGTFDVSARNNSCNSSTMAIPDSIELRFEQCDAHRLSWWHRNLHCS